MGHPKALSFLGPTPPHGYWTTRAERRGFGRVKALGLISASHGLCQGRQDPSFYTPHTTSQRPELLPEPGRKLAKC